MRKMYGTIDIVFFPQIPMPDATPNFEAMIADLEREDPLTAGANKVDPKKIGMPKQILDVAGLNG